MNEEQTTQPEQDSVTEKENSVTLEAESTEDTSGNDKLDKRLAELEERYNKELKRLEHGLGKSIGKLRQRNRALEEIISKLIPDPSGVQFKSEEDRKAYESYAKPIIEDIKKKTTEIETQEKNEELENLRSQLVQATVTGLQGLPDAQDIISKYNQAISMGSEYDLDDDILAFTANNPALLRVLYANPQQIPLIKRLPTTSKTAALVSLLSQTYVQPNTQQKQKIQPAAPLNKGVGVSGDIEDTLDGDAYLEWYRKRRIKDKGK